MLSATKTTTQRQATRIRSPLNEAGAEAAVLTLAAEAAVAVAAAVGANQDQEARLTLEAVLQAVDLRAAVAQAALPVKVASLKSPPRRRRRSPSRKRKPPSNRRQRLSPRSVSRSQNPSRARIPNPRKVRRRPTTPSGHSISRTSPSWTTRHLRKASRQYLTSQRKHR